VTKLAPDSDSAKVLVEVPRAAVPDAMTLPWAEVLTSAAQLGWVVKKDASHFWCRPDHALLREGSDEMRGIPVLYHQRW